jgi:hypothetical protein
MIVVYDYFSELIVGRADNVNIVSATVPNPFILSMKQIMGNHDLLPISCIKKLIDYVMIPCPCIMINKFKHFHILFNFNYLYWY